MDIFICVQGSCTLDHLYFVCFSKARTSAFGSVGNKYIKVRALSYIQSLLTFVNYIYSLLKFSWAIAKRLFNGELDDTAGVRSPHFYTSTYHRYRPTLSGDIITSCYQYQTGKQSNSRFLQLTVALLMITKWISTGRRL